MSMVAAKRNIARHAVGLTLGLLLLSAGGLHAQLPTQWDPNRLQVTRQGLEELLSQYEQADKSGAYSADLKARARYEASLIRTRLEEGDFQVGDQIQLVVEGQESLSDTFPVLTGRVISLPMIGQIPLKGVLRSELEPYLTKELSRYIRDPVVHARSLIRVLVTGEIGQPGFYVVPAEELLSDAIMAAGGPSADAKLTEVRIERGTHTIWDGPPLQKAIAEGRTMDQLSLQAGDQIIIPRKANSNVWDVLRIGLITLPPLIYGLTRIF